MTNINLPIKINYAVTQMKPEDFFRKSNYGIDFYFWR